MSFNVKEKKKKLVGEADYEKVGSGFAQPKSSLLALKEFLERNGHQTKKSLFSTGSSLYNKFILVYNVREIQHSILSCILFT
jgi:hypothetical protein